MRSLFDLIGHDGSADEIVVDLFAGGGGASEGIRMALGRDPEVAVNHNPKAVSMHRVNHPGTVHYTEDVWSVSPTHVTKGRPVGLLWASPDCTHFSKAKGGAPVRDDRIRSLAMVLVDKWIPAVRPRVIIMENVEEFTTWGPLDRRGRIIKAEAGKTFRQFINRLRRQGYRVEWRELRACDYGAPTIRKRLFLIARCDGQTITWPEPTHGDPKSEAVQAAELLPWRTAAECIDWAVPCPSIFETSEEIWERYGVRAKRPLADKTLRRIAEGVRRYVVECAEPFVVTNTTGHAPGAVGDPLATVTTGGHHGVVAPHVSKMRTGAVGHGMDTTMHTVTAGGKARRMSTGNPLALVAPYLVKSNHGYKYFRGNAVDEPLRTCTASQPGFSLVSPIIEAHYGGQGARSLRLPDAREPMRTLSTDNRFGLVTPTLIQTGYGEREGQATDEPLRTISAGGLHHAEVRAFLCKYYGQGAGQAVSDPMHTVTAQDRFGIVTVAGEQYVIADIGMRMLQPRELYRAQGFPDSYIIDRTADGATITKTDQVRMCGNSVCPPMAAALVRANVELRVSVGV